MARRNAGARLEWRADRNVWEIIWFKNGSRKRRSTATGDKALAQTRLAEFILSQHNDNGWSNNPAQRLIGDVLADYLIEKGKTLKEQKTLLWATGCLEGFWSELTVTSVNETRCREYVTHRIQKSKKGIKPHSVRRELEVLQAALNHDFRAGRLGLQVHVWKPKAGEHRDRWLTRGEVAKLLWHLRYKKSQSKTGEATAKENKYNRGDSWHLRLFILMSLYTGARKEAILSLRWPQVDLERGLIDLNPPGRERTSKGRPIIKIPNKLVMHLRIARKRAANQDGVIAMGHVIHRNQKPLKNIAHGFREACRRAGLGSDVTPHTLRHTTASWMAQAGVSFPVMARFLGHTSSKMTEKVYAHHAPDYLSPAANALDRIKVRG